MFKKEKRKKKRKEKKKKRKKKRVKKKRFDEDPSIVHGSKKIKKNLLG